MIDPASADPNNRHSLRMAIAAADRDEISAASALDRTAIDDREIRRFDGKWTNPGQFASGTAGTSSSSSDDGNDRGDLAFPETLVPSDAKLDGANYVFSLENDEPDANNFVYRFPHD